MSTLVYDLKYASIEALTAGKEQALRHGGAFINAETAPPALSTVSIRVLLPNEKCFDIQSRVVNIMPGGFYVQFVANEHYDQLMVHVAEMLDGSQETAKVDAGPTTADGLDITTPEPSTSLEESEGLAPPLSGPMKNVFQLIDMGSGVPLGQQVRALSVADRVRLARQANRPVRALLIRDTEKRIHVEVVKNPKTTDDEIVDWSALPGISPLALKWISTQKRLMRNRVLQLNLVKNPMTPQNIALKLVKLLHISDCRKIAKSSQVREAIARVARKRVAEYVEKM